MVDGLLFSRGVPRFMNRTHTCEVCGREYDTDEGRIEHIRTIGLVD